MSDETSLAYQQAKAAYIASLAEAGVSGQDPAGVDSSALVAAAQAHADAAGAEGRTLDVVQAEYLALLDTPGAMDENREAFAALGQELGVLRSAVANTQGNLPGSGHSASVGVGA